MTDDLVALARQSRSAEGKDADQERPRRGTSSAQAAATSTPTPASQDLGPCYVGKIKDGRIRSENDRLLQRAVSHVYRVIIAPAEEGGLKEWFHDNCLVFDDRAEHKMAYTALFQEYERKMEAALQDFAKAEGLQLHQVYESFSQGKEEDQETDKTVQLLLAATDYPKFVKIMRRRARARRKKEGLAADSGGSIACLLGGDRGGGGGSGGGGGCSRNLSDQDVDRIGKSAADQYKNK